MWQCGECGNLNIVEGAFCMHCGERKKKVMRGPVYCPICRYEGVGEEKHLFWKTMDCLWFLLESILVLILLFSGIRTIPSLIILWSWNDRVNKMNRSLDEVWCPKCKNRNIKIVHSSR